MHQHLIHRTKDIYDNNALAFDQQRNNELFEKEWLDRFLSSVRDGASILDLGCGSGRPIAEYLIAKRCRVTGVDFSAEMLKMAAKRFPDQFWLRQDMRELSLPQQYDGIVSWNAFFHLCPVAQREMFATFHKYLKPGGVLLLTIGDKKGEVTGKVNGHKVYHASLSLTEYKALLVQHRLLFLDAILRDPNCQGHSILLAQKSLS